MNISALSLIALVAAAGTAATSAQIATVHGDRRHVRRNNAARQRAQQMRKLVDAMSVQPDPVPVPTTPPPEPTPPPTPEPTPEPTPSPTDDTCDEKRRAYVGLGLDGEVVDYLKKGNCKDASGNVYSYGEISKDADDFDDCAKMCEKAMPTGLLGIDYTCSGKDQHLCHCLIPPAGATRSATASTAFKHIVEGSGTGYPAETASKVGLKDFLNSGHDEVLCGTANPAVGTEIAKEA
jgi:hypothetical protein